MPSVNLDSLLFPKTLFTQIDEGNVEGQWWVLHTRPRTEKAIARFAKAQGDSYFLPLGTTRRLVQRRWVETQLPLFPGYFFLHGDEQSYLRTLKTNKVVSSISVPDQVRLQQDLRNLNRLLESNRTLSPHPEVVVGDRVEITQGSLSGLRGIVTRCDGKTRIVVEVKMLNQQVSAQIDGCLLQKV